MKIYIANTSNQMQTVNCRIPEMTGILTRIIPFGGQLSMGGTKELNTPQIEAIVRQISDYGAVCMTDIGRIEGYVSLVYSLDKPVPAAFMQQVVRHNKGHLAKQGKEIREQTAVAISSAMESQSGDKGGTLDVLIQQEKPAHAIDSSGVDLSDDAVSEEITVTRNSEAAEKKQRGRPRRS